MKGPLSFVFCLCLASFPAHSFAQGASSAIPPIVTFLTEGPDLLISDDFGANSLASWTVINPESTWIPPAVDMNSDLEITAGQLTSELFSDSVWWQDHNKPRQK